VRRAIIACVAALAAGLAIGLLAASGDDAGAADQLRPAGVSLQRVATPAVGSIDVPALKVRRTTTDTPPPPPPPPPPASVTSPAVTPPPVITPPPPVVVPPPPPPPPAPVDGGRRPG
jgi:hypothetical protein